MAYSRFPTMRALYETFPSARDDVGADPSDHDPLWRLRRLTEVQAWESAVSLCAYLLPRRETVWWGCQTLQAIRKDLDSTEKSAVDAALAWVGNPTESLRREALKQGLMGDVKLPGIWLALAAGWSGGSILPPEYGMMPAGPQQTARAVRAGLLIALTLVPNDDYPALLAPCIEQFTAIANGQAITV